MRIRNKRLMYQLFEKGEFGNRPRTWGDLTDLLASDFRGEVGMFQKDPRGGGGLVRYNVPVAAAAEHTAKWATKGVRPTDIQYTEMAPHQHNLIQGEVMGPSRLPWSAETCDWSMSYNCAVGLTMRDARALPWRQSGKYTRTLLRQLLDRPSFNNLEYLLDQYPEHAVEFSTFRVPVGVLGWNTIFWEVRLY